MNAPVCGPKKARCTTRNENRFTPFPKAYDIRKKQFAFCKAGAKAKQVVFSIEKMCDLRLRLYVCERKVDEEREDYKRC